MHRKNDKISDSDLSRATIGRNFFLCRHTRDNVQRRSRGRYYAHAGHIGNRFGRARNSLKNVKILVENDRNGEVENGRDSAKGTSVICVRGTTIKLEYTTKLISKEIP